MGVYVAKGSNAGEIGVPFFFPIWLSAGLSCQLKSEVYFHFLHHHLLILFFKPLRVKYVLNSKIHESLWIRGMPRATIPQERNLADKTLVVDNGGYTLKAGFASHTPALVDCHVIPNCLARDRAKRIWVGAQLERCTDFGEIAFRRPVEKGFLVNWEAEKAVWDASFIDRGAILQVQWLMVLNLASTDHR